MTACPPGVRRLGLALLAPLLALGWMSIAQAAAAQPVTQPRAEQCTTSRPDPSVQRRTCVTITSVGRRPLQTVLSDGVDNQTKRPVRMTCTAPAASLAWRLSAGVEDVQGAIFTGVSAAVDGGISHRVTSAAGSTTRKKVPAKTSMRCDYGISSYAFRGKVTIVTCVQTSCLTWTREFSGVAPQAALWHVYVER